MKDEKNTNKHESRRGEGHEHAIKRQDVIELVSFAVSLALVVLGIGYVAMMTGQNGMPGTDGTRAEADGNLHGLNVNDAANRNAEDDAGKANVDANMAVSPLATRGDLLASGKVTEDDLRGVDVGRFIDEYEIRANELDDLNVGLLLQDYKGELDGKREKGPYAYLADAGRQVGGGVSEGDIEGIRTVAIVTNPGTSQYLYIADLAGRKAFTATQTGVEGFQEKDATSTVTLSDDASEAVREALRGVGVWAWKERYQGTDDGSTDPTHWTAYIETADETVHVYVGTQYGNASGGKPEGFDALVDAVERAAGK